MRQHQSSSQDIYLARLPANEDSDSSLSTLNKPIPRRARMGNDTRESPLVIEDDSVRTRTAAVILLEVVEDRELLVWPGDVELEILVVAERVRILARSLGLARLEELEAFSHRGGHGPLEVAYAAAGRGAGLGLALGEQ